MPRPKGPCKTRNRCDACCPATENGYGRRAGKWDTIALGFDFPNVGMTAGVTLSRTWDTLYNAPIDLQDGSGTACIPGDCDCNVDGTFTCQCEYTYRTTLTGISSSCDPISLTCPDSYLSVPPCVLVQASFACNTLISDSFIVEVDFADPADCSSNCLYDGVNPVQGVYAELDADTLVCQCPDNLSAVFGPPAKFVGTGLTFDADGTITVMATDDDTVACPDTAVCPERDPTTHAVRPGYIVIRWDDFIIDGTHYLEGCVSLCKRPTLPGFIGGANLGPYEFGMYLTEGDPATIQFRLIVPVDLYIDTATAVSTDGFKSIYNDPIIYTIAGHTIEIDGLRAIPCPCPLA